MTPTMMVNNSISNTISDSISDSNYSCYYFFLKKLKKYFLKKY